MSETIPGEALIILHVEDNLSHALVRIATLLNHSNLPSSTSSSKNSSTTGSHGTSLLPTRCLKSGLEAKALGKKIREILDKPATAH